MVEEAPGAERMAARIKPVLGSVELRPHELDRERQLTREWRTWRWARGKTAPKKKANAFQFAVWVGIHQTFQLSACIYQNHATVQRTMAFSHDHIFLTKKTNPSKLLTK
jgi:hypothetical protein